MSADAKVWFDPENSIVPQWEGIHDGECENPNSHHGISYDLVEVLGGIERCMKVKSLRWEFRTYPDGHVGLVGYVT